MADVVPRVPLLPLRQPSGREPIKIEGYSISPSVATTTLFLAISYVSLALAPTSPYVFATMTNLCYIAAGFWREAVASTDKHSATLLVGQMAGGSMILVMMGASSFAFHRESQLFSPAHTLDILFGWVLVSHAFYVSFSVSVLALVRRLTGDNSSLPRRVVRSVMSIGFLVMVTLLMTFYDEFYANQLVFYFSAGPLAALFTAACRFILVYEEGKLQWGAVRVALFELLVSLVAVIAAIDAQGTLLGRPLSKDTTPREYDFYHGNWHFLLTISVGTLYSRAADAARIVQGTHTVCVCSLPWLDWVAMTLILVYSSLIMIFKETSVEITTAIGVLAFLAVGFLLHGMLTLGVWAVGAADDPLITPRPLGTARRSDTPRAPRGMPAPQRLPPPDPGIVEVTSLSQRPLLHIHARSFSGP